MSNYTILVMEDNEDINNINLMEEYLVNSQIEEEAIKYDLRPGMGMSAIQIGIPKRYIVIKRKK